MKVMLIRHFQTQGNLEKRYVGRTDEPLLMEEGAVRYMEERQSKLRLFGEPDDVVASPMKRCIQTARYLFPGKEPILCPQMRECDFGSFEGKSYGELKDLPAYQEWLDSRGRLPFPEGEAHEAFKDRCVEGFCRMADQLLQRECNLAAMVVHGGTIMAILSQLGRLEGDSLDGQRAASLGGPEGQSPGRQKSGFYTWQVGNGGGFLISLDEGQWRQGQKIWRGIQRL